MLVTLFRSWKELTWCSAGRHRVVYPATLRLRLPTEVRRGKGGFVGRGQWRFHFVQVAAFVVSIRTFVPEFEMLLRTLGSEIIPGVWT